MAHQLFSLTKVLVSPSTFLLEAALSFPGYKTWVYFDSGEYQTWDILNEKLL